jgi:hypothetical protein
MRMKIVGGPHDGQEWEVRSESYIVLVKVQPPRTYLTYDQEDPSPIDGTTAKIVYTVRRLHSRHPDDLIEEFCFLAPVGMTDMEAIKHQFSK